MEPEVVPQTDLVPTLALLLGVPIPYSSVGQVLLPLFPQNGSRGAPTGLSQAEALWINVKQVRGISLSLCFKVHLPELSCISCFLH